jgi:hypothetical protein
MIYRIQRIGSRLEVSGRIDTSAAIVWDIITDTRWWHRWGTSIRSVHSRTRRIERESVGQVEILPGIRLPFRIQRLIEGVYWDWSVGGVKATGHRIDPISDNACRLVFTLPLWGAPYAGICLLALRSIRGLPLRRK